MTGLVNQILGSFIRRDQGAVIAEQADWNCASHLGLAAYATLCFIPISSHLQPFVSSLLQFFICLVLSTLPCLLSASRKYSPSVALSRGCHVHSWASVKTTFLAPHVRLSSLLFHLNSLTPGQCLRFQRLLRGGEMLRVMAVRMEGVRFLSMRRSRLPLGKGSQRHG